MRLDERRIVADIRSKLSDLGYDVAVQPGREFTADIVAKGTDRVVLIDVTAAPRVVAPQVIAIASGSHVAREQETMPVRSVLVYLGEIDNQARELARISGVSTVRLDPEGTVNPLRLILTSREAYSRILAWHKKNSGKVEGKGSEDYRRKYLDYLNSAPPVEEASRAEMIRMADEVLMGLLEWAFHEKDESGEPLNQYARIIMDELGTSRRD